MVAETVIQLFHLVSKLISVKMGMYKPRKQNELFAKSLLHERYERALTRYRDSVLPLPEITTFN